MVACLAQVGCRRDLPSGSDRRAFDPVQWKADQASDAHGDDPSVRQEMLRDLVAGTLPGKARGEIEELLGPSLVTGYFTETKRDLIYFLGPERDNYIRIDSEWLLIWLDAQGRFHHYEIATD